MSRLQVAESRSFLRLRFKREESCDGRVRPNRRIHFASGAVAGFSDFLRESTARSEALFRSNPILILSSYQSLGKSAGLLASSLRFPRVMNSRTAPSFHDNDSSNSHRPLRINRGYRPAAFEN